MTDKIQMTEEQADRFISDLNIKKYKDSIDFDDINLFIIHRMKKEGYILKSDLQQKVEDAEDYYRIFKQKDYNIEQEYAFMREVLISCYEALKLIKQSHPEFKK